MTQQALGPGVSAVPGPQPRGVKRFPGVASFRFAPLPCPRPAWRHLVLRAYPTLFPPSAANTEFMGAFLFVLFEALGSPFDEVAAAVHLNAKLDCQDR